MSATTTTQQAPTMTLDEAYEYVEHAIQAESEQAAEAGMSAVAMGFDPYDGMIASNRYRTAADPTFAEAERILAADQAERDLVRVILVHPDDLPF